MFENDYNYVIIILCTCGGMVDAADSKSAGGNFVGVQVPSRAPLIYITYLVIFLYKKVINLFSDSYY